jgi:uncharacterized protein (TIGR04255 family)
MTESAVALPDYDNPPVTEVVFGIQFERIRGLKAPHTGILWERLGRQDYPECQEKPPLNHVIESFEDNPPNPQSITFYDSPPLPRLFFINNEGDQFVQVQEDRFHQNWRKLKSDDEYPRYVTLYPKFLESWHTFIDFMKSVDLGEPKPDQYELTYVNHIHRDAGWKTLSDVGELFPSFTCEGTDGFLPEPESFSWRRIYRFPDNRGRLHVSLRLAVSKETKDQVMILDLTARGFLKENMEAWFNMAHEWIVKGFSDLTGGSIQRSIWKRKQ